MENWLICIGTGKAQAPLIAAAQAAGFRVLGLDRAPNRALCDDSLQVSTYDAEAARLAVQVWVEKHVLPLALVARTSGPAVMTAALVADSLGLPGFSQALAEASVSKYALYRQCTELGVATIATVRCTPEVSTANLSYPLIVKPDQALRGKENVYCVRNSEEFSSALGHASQESVNGAGVVQPLIPGTEFGLVAGVRAGQMLWSAFYAERVEQSGWKMHGRGVVGPCLDLPKTIGNTARENARKLLDIWRCTGFCFFSFRVDEHGTPLLFEVNPGLCGDQIVDRLFPSIWPGSDFFALDIALMSGQPVAFPTDEGRWSEILTQGIE